MAADESGGGGAGARLSVQHIVQRPFALGSGGCRSGAASLSGGKSCKSGGKSGRCRAAAGPLHSPPLLMVLLCQDATIGFSVSLLSSSFLFSSCVASNKNKNI